MRPFFFVLAPILLAVSPIFAQTDLSTLTPTQQQQVKKILSERHCTCGCDMTIATCRVEDPSCETSAKLAQSVVDEVRKATPKIDLRRVDLSHLPAQKQVAVFNILSEKKCTCGCDMTIAKCLVEDESCQVSPKLAREIIKTMATQSPSTTTKTSSQKTKLKSDGGKWYKEVVGRQLLYMYTGNGYRRKERIWLCSNGTFQTSGSGGSISSLGSAAFSDGQRQGHWAVNGDILTLAFQSGKTAKYKLSFYNGFLYLDNTRYFRVKNELCK